MYLNTCTLGVDRDALEHPGGRIFPILDGLSPLLERLTGKRFAMMVTNLRTIFAVVLALGVFAPFCEAKSMPLSTLNASVRVCNTFVFMHFQIERG